MLWSVFLAKDTVDTLSRHSMVQAKWCNALLMMYFLPPLLELCVIQGASTLCLHPGVAACLTLAMGL